MARKIIIDTDPGVDDVLAILFALASPEVNVAAISIVFGNTHAPVAHANLLKIYYLLAQEIATIPEAASRYSRLQGQEKTILALGEDGPIDGDKAVAAYFHGPDGLSNISVSHPHFTPPVLENDATHDHLEISKKPAHEVILDILTEEDEGTVTIVALGPLTNIARAYRADPQTFSKVLEVVWMGGALDVPGNTSPCSEFNSFADPYAASEILDNVRKGAFKFVMAPLDITTPHQIPFEDLIHPTISGSTLPDKITSGPPTPLQNFVSAMLLRVRGLHASFGLPDAMEMHDPVAVWYAVCQAASGGSVGALAEGWAVCQREFKIERKGELTRGMCVVDRRGTGEEGEGDRTKSDKLLGGAVPSVEKVVVKEEGKLLPYVIVKTPGSRALREVLLGRVFGIKA